MSTKQIYNKPILKPYRRKLRSNLTPAEAFLWTHLKNKQLEGRRFRRQFSIHNYIVDFYCPAEKLVLELDGEIHNNAIAIERDRIRDAKLNKMGIKVLRFENSLVFDKLEWVLEEIKNSFIRV